MEQTLWLRGDMPLIRIPFKGGFNKQITQSEAANQWTDGDFVRFRYGEPEKIGGWSFRNCDNRINIYFNKWFVNRHCQ